MPPASRFGDALADDDDMARAWMSQNADASPDRHPRFADWDPKLAELTVISDRIGELIATVASLGGSKVKVAPRLRPRTAGDRIREAMRLETHQSWVTRLLPGRQNNDDTDNADGG